MKILYAVALVACVCVTAAGAQQYVPAQETQQIFNYVSKNGQRLVERSGTYVRALDLPNFEPCHSIVLEALSYPAALTLDAVCALPKKNPNGKFTDKDPSLHANIWIDSGAVYVRATNTTYGDTELLWIVFQILATVGKNSQK